MSTEGWGSVKIRVTTSDLKRKADEVVSRIDRVQKLFERMDACIKGTKGYWIGAGGEAHRNAYEMEKETIALILCRLREYPVDLLKISGNYESGEQNLTDGFGVLAEHAIT